MTKIIENRGVAEVFYCVILSPPTQAFIPRRCWYEVSYYYVLSFIVASFSKQISCNKKPFPVSFKENTPT